MQALQYPSLEYVNLAGNNLTESTRVHINQLSQHESMCWTGDGIDALMPDVLNSPQTLAQYWAGVRYETCSPAPGQNPPASCFACHDDDMLPRAYGNNLVTYNNTLYRTLDAHDPTNPRRDQCQNGSLA